MFTLKKGHQPGVYVPLRALFLVHQACSFTHTFFDDMNYCLSKHSDVS